MADPHLDHGHAQSLVTWSSVIDGGPHLTLGKWARKYGPIFSCKMGSQKVVVISDHKMLKVLFAKDVLTGRPRNPVFTAYSNNCGVAMSDGKNWEVQRQFLIKNLKIFGFGKAPILERRIIGELEEGLATFFENNSNIPIAGNGLFLPFVTVTVWGLMVSDVDVEEKKDVAELVEAFISSFNAVTESGLLFFPVLRFIAPGFFGWTAYRKSIVKLREFVNKRINKNKIQLDASNPIGFIDHYLAKIESTRDESSPFYKDLGHNNLVAVVTDMFIASIDTTRLTLEWAMIYLSQERHVQLSLQKEINEVIGNSRAPSLSDKKMMPYTEAVILEILRLSNVLSLGVPRRLLEDIAFQDYTLEKDSLIIANLFSILHDPTLWGKDAMRFNPERFLNEDKSKLVRKDAFLPFSIGKRKCLGESMSMDTLFLYIIYIFQNYNVEPDPECCIADLSSIPGLVMTPKPFRVVVKQRRDD